VLRIRKIFGYNIGYCRHRLTEGSAVFPQATHERMRLECSLPTMLQPMHSYSLWSSELYL
jgi:hypothetical protein